MKFEQGSTVFSERGQEYIYVSETDGAHVVRPIYEAFESGEPHEGDPVIVRALFTSPPVERFHSEVAALDAKITLKRSELDSMRTELLDLSKGEKERMTRLKQHAALQHLDDFIAGRITHFVFHPAWQQVAVVPKDEALAENSDRWKKELKLLTLYGRANGDLQFQVNAYADGSGSSTEATPFCSEQGAIAFAKELIAGRISAALGNMQGRSWDSEIANAIKYGVEVPAALLENQRQIRLEQLRKNEKELSGKLAKTQADISAATA